MDAAVRTPRLIRRLLLWGAAGFLAVSAAAAQAPRLGQAGPFYNVDRETRLAGTVVEIRFEPRYEGTAPFLMIVLSEEGSGRRTLVEISPSWFFEEDIHRGERVKVVGSLVTGEGGDGTLIARQVQFRGETVAVRDAKGFPNWRGGAAARRKGRIRGRGE